MTVEGLTTIASRFDPAETMEQIVAQITARGMTVMALIDHAAAAAKVNMALDPTEVVIFGNPRAGTPLMQAAQTFGIDLPLRILVWRDRAGKTWLGYNNPEWLAARHGTGPEVAPTIAAMSHALADIAATVAAAPASF